MNTSAHHLLQPSIKHDHCKVLVKSQPQIQDLSIIIQSNNNANFQPEVTNKGESGIETSLEYPFHNKDVLYIMANDNELSRIDLQQIQLDKSRNQLSYEKAFQVSHMRAQYEICVYFELQLSNKLEGLVDLQSQQQQQEQEYLTIDISVSGIPIRQKCFSCFPSVPLAYYEIVSLKPQSPQPKSKLTQEEQEQFSNVLYQSEITRLPSQDPVWMPSKKLSKFDLQPSFRVNVYNSSDQAKSRMVLIGGCDIDFQTVIEGKEFMFEMDGLENTHVLIDRIQILK